MLNVPQACRPASERNLTRSTAPAHWCCPAHAYLTSSRRSHLNTPTLTFQQHLFLQAGAQPLIVRGPGAGAEVTAGGVFSDLLRLAAYLGAPS